MSHTSLTELLSLTSAPVAITFVDAPPPGVPHVSAVEPAPMTRRPTSPSPACASAPSRRSWR